MTLNEDEWNEYEPVSDSTKLPNEDHGCEVDLLPNEDHGCEVDLLPNENHGCEVDLLPNGHFPSDPQNNKGSMLAIHKLNKNSLNEEMLRRLRTY